MSNAILQFEEERKQRIAQNGAKESLLKSAKQFNIESNGSQYSYNFSWMGRPIIQYPQDMVAMQELIWEIKPEFNYRNRNCARRLIGLLCFFIGIDRPRRSVGC